MFLYLILYCVLPFFVILNLCYNVVHELSSVWRLCIFSKFCLKGVYYTDVSSFAGEGRAQN